MTTPSPRSRRLTRALEFSARYRISLLLLGVAAFVAGVVIGDVGPTMLVTSAFGLVYLLGALEQWSLGWDQGSHAAADSASRVLVDLVNSIARLDARNHPATAAPTTSPDPSDPSCTIYPEGGTISS